MAKFQSYLMVDRGLAQITADGYCRTVSISLKRMRRFVPKYPHIKEHMRRMYHDNMSYSYIVNTQLGLEHYTRFKGNVIKFNRPKKPKRLIKDVLSEAEISRMIECTKNAREKAMICVLSFTGSRNNEFCNIRLEDVDLGRNQIAIRDGKNRQDGVVNISPECTRAIINYLRQYPRENEQYLFTTLRQNSRLATGDLRKLIRVLALRANIGRRVYPHLFRHSLATNLLNRGASLMMIQQQLRHRFIESTMIYVISRPVRNRSEYDFYKPAYM